MGTQVPSGEPSAIPVPVADGGTGSTTAAGAVAALGLTAALKFKGGITVAADFPTTAAVLSGDFYTALADVTDNDPAKTNTGTAFLVNDEFAWNGSGWTNYGTSRAHVTTHQTGGSDVLTDLPAAATVGGTGRLVSEIATAILRSSVSLTWAAAPADDVSDRISFPFDACQVLAINVAPIGAAGLAGTLAVLGGVDGLGATLLTAATFDLTTLTANTLAALTLTGTTADLQGDDTDGITLTMSNADVPHLVTVVFGGQ